MKKVLLFSASSYKDSGYLTHAKPYIEEFLKEVSDEQILFIPFAGVRRTYDEYELKVKEALNSKNLVSIHRFKDYKDAVKNAKIILVGGGNTFMLLSKLYEFDLVDLIKTKVCNGTYYIGWSAGSNIAGLSIKTTNDMPIIMPKTFDALALINYQINPHFISGKIANHNGESREERLQEFLIANQDKKIIALPEGSALKINNNQATIIGHHDALEFSYLFNKKDLKLNEIFDL